MALQLSRMTHDTCGPTTISPSFRTGSIPTRRVYEREIERIFHGPTWNYVALEAEIPNPGDYIRSNVGPTPIVVSRAEDGSISAFENRCVHRASEFCRELSGTANEFICPYHQWTYDLKGNLIGIPFRRGVGRQGRHAAGFQDAGARSPQARGDQPSRRRVRVLLGRLWNHSPIISDPR